MSSPHGPRIARSALPSRADAETWRRTHQCHRVRSLAVAQQRRRVTCIPGVRPRARRSGWRSARRRRSWTAPRRARAACRARALIAFLFRIDLMALVSYKTQLQAATAVTRSLKLRRGAQVIAATCIGAGDARLSGRAFRLVVLDEATQARPRPRRHADRTSFSVVEGLRLQRERAAAVLCGEAGTTGRDARRPPSPPRSWRCCAAAARPCSWATPVSSRRRSCPSRQTLKPYGRAAARLTCRLAWQRGRGLLLQQLKRRLSGTRPSYPQTAASFQCICRGGAYRPAHGRFARPAGRAA
jgi:hypothetical protein